MQLVNIFSAIYPLLMTISFAMSLTVLYAKLFKLDNHHLVLSAWLTAPFLLSLGLYTLFFIAPGQNQFFYLSILSLIVFISYFYYGKHFPFIGFCLGISSWFTKIIKSNFAIKMIEVFVLIIVFFCSLRIFFWPINWDDQIYYVEQSYALGKLRSIQPLLNWDYFNNGTIKFQINPAIRPGIPLIYAFSALLAGDLTPVKIFSQAMTFYFMVVSISVIINFSKKITPGNHVAGSVFTLLLVFSSYEFVSLTIQGFKELPIMCLIILILDVLVKKDFYKSLNILFYLGLLLGLISYINISGSFLVCVFLPIYILLNRFGIIRKLLFTLLLVTIITFSSGMEFPYLFEWVITGGGKPADTLKALPNFINRLQPQKFKTEVLTDTGSATEYQAYKINNTVDIYTKGKLQGFFQFQYYGLIFLVFIFVLTARIKYLLQNKLILYFLLFIGAYYLLFIDIFNFNKFSYAYVLTVSHKYTAMIVPLIGLIIGSQWGWIRDRFLKLTPNIIIIVSILMILLTEFIIPFYFNDILNITGIFVPIHNTKSYYMQVISKANNVILYISLLFVIYYVYLKLLKKDKIFYYWQLNNIGCVVGTFVVFVVPFFFFFNTNYGIKETLIYSFSSQEKKLDHIKGWESIYSMVNYLNRMSPPPDLLAVNINFNQIEYHLNFPSSKVNLLTDTPIHSNDKKDVINNIRKYNSKYLLIPAGKYNLPLKNRVFSTESLSLYQTEFSD